MAFLSKSASFIFISAFCFLVLVQLQLSDCNMDSGCLYVQAAPHKIYNRKLLIGVEATNALVRNGGKGTNVGADWELRQAPLGPDPLHHHGGNPRKPTTP